MKDGIILLCTLAVGLAVGSGTQYRHDLKVAKAQQDVATKAVGDFCEAKLQEHSNHCQALIHKVGDLCQSAINQQEVLVMTQEVSVDVEDTGVTDCHMGQVGCP